MVAISQTQCMTLRSKKPETLLVEERDPKQERPQDQYSSPDYRRQIVWWNAIGFLLLHLAAVYGLLLLAIKAKFITWAYVVVFNVISGLGVTVGAHRMYTHRCFKATWPVRLALVMLHTIAGQNCMYIWVRDHRQHHKFSDTDADPHNATRGFFFSHIGWLMVRKHPSVLKMGHTVDLSDLEADPIVMFQKNYYKTLYFFSALCFPIALPIWGWNEDPWVALFGCYFFRMIILLNITWLVNSAAHLYGNRPYNKQIEPVESSFVAFWSLGEGWHNYHHCFPWDYRAAELGQKYDLSTKVIDYLASKGWAYDLKSASESMVRRRILTCGDGSHHSHHPEPEPEPEVDNRKAGAAGEAREFVQVLATKEATMSIG